MEFLIISLLLGSAVGWLFMPGSDTDSAAAPDDTDDNSLNERNYGADADTVSGTDTGDLLRLGDGDDIADSDDGDDTIYGQDGADEVAGGPGDDRIFLGDGADQNFLTGDSSPAQVAGDDFLRGGDAADTLIDFLGSNTIYGDLGADLIDAVDADGTAMTPDSLYGGYGPDVIAGDAGDLMSGGPGVDTFFVILNAGPVTPPVITDYARGEDINITVPLAFQGQGATLDPTDSGIDVRLGETVILRLDGVTDPDDVAIRLRAADIADQTILPGRLALGTDGDDRITTGHGDDAVFAGRGVDAITTGGGDDYISLRGARPFSDAGDLGWGANTVDAGAGDDRVLGGQGADTVNAGSGDDLVLGGGGADLIRGGSGDDVLDGTDADRGHSDTIFGGSGADRILLDDGDLVAGGRGIDSYDIAEFRTGDDPVRITDFDPARESLSIGMTGGNLDISYRHAGDSTEVLVGGRHVLTLDDVSPAAAAGADIIVRRLG